MNGTIKIISGASNSVIQNLQIQNSNEQGIGVYLVGVDNVTIKNNNLQMNALHGYGIVATRSNYTKIINNTIKQTPTINDATHCAILFGDCHYNTISQNNIEIIIKTSSNGMVNANGIYLCTYNTTLIDGGLCNYNNITNNTIKGGNTSFCYTIQMMGNYNLAQDNTVYDGYIGISSAGSENKIINNTISALKKGISAGLNTTIDGNLINLNDDANGIEIIKVNGNIVLNNEITTTNIAGIIIESCSDNILKNNTIKTNSAEGILLKGDNGNKNNTLINNIIITNSTGILLKRQSRVKKPNNITIQNNTITTTSNYTIDAYESENITFTNNNLSSAKGKGTATIRYPGTNNGEYDDTISNKTYNLTDENYNTYFNTDGTLNHTIVGREDTFNITGPLYNKNMTIDLPITINGNLNYIYNGTIKILTEGSGTKVSNLKIKNENQIGIILYETGNVEIIDNELTVNQTAESYGIYLHDSTYNKIINNTVYSYGDYVNYGIFLYSSDYNQVLKNHVNTISNDIEVPYQSEIMFNGNIGIIKQIYTTYGIIAIYSSHNNLDENIINLTSLFKEPKNATDKCHNSMVGLDIYYNSDFNTANNNQVNVIGNNPYSYGMGVLGSDCNPTGTALETAKGNSFENNTITVGGNYFATGIIAGLGSVDTLIKNNRILVNSNSYSYGITLEASQRSTILQNNITLYSPAIYGIEVYGSNNNTIKENNIDVTGYYKYGIACHSSTHNNIIQNIIKTENNGTIPIINTPTHTDVIPLGDCGLILTINSNSNIINSNIINSASEFTINITNSSQNNTITENSLVSSDKIGTNSITGGINNTLNNNGGQYQLSIDTDDIVAKIGDTITLTAKVNSTSGNADGLRVTFKIGLMEIGTSVVKNGIAQLTYTIPTTLDPTYYDLKASVSGENYITRTVTKTIELTKPTTVTPNPVVNPTPTVTPNPVVNPTKINTKITAPKVYATYNVAKNLIITLKDVNGNVLANKIVNVNIGTIKKTLKTNNKGQIFVQVSNLVPKTYTATIKFAGDSSYKSSSANTKITVYKTTPKIITTAKKTFKIKTNRKKLNITLKNNKGKVLKNTKITVKIGKKTYTATTNNKGTAIVNIKLNKKGKYTATIQYAGNKYYKPIKKKIIITIKK